MPGDGFTSGQPGRADCARRSELGSQESVRELVESTPQHHPNIHLKKRMSLPVGFSHTLSQPHAMNVSNFKKSGLRLSKLVQALDTPRLAQQNKGYKTKLDVSEKSFLNNYNTANRRPGEPFLCDFTDRDDEVNASTSPPSSRLHARRHSIAVVPSTSPSSLIPVSRPKVNHDLRKQTPRPAADFSDCTIAARSSPVPKLSETPNADMKPLFPILKNRRSFTTTPSYTISNTYFRNPGYKVSFREEIEEVQCSPSGYPNWHKRRGSLPECSPDRFSSLAIRESDEISDISENKKVAEKTYAEQNLLPSRKKTPAPTIHPCKQRRYSIAFIPQHTPRSKDISGTDTTRFTHILTTDKTKTVDDRSVLTDVGKEQTCNDDRSVSSLSSSAGEDEDDTNDVDYADNEEEYNEYYMEEVQDLTSYSESVPMTRDDGVVVYVCHAHVPLAKIP